MKRSGKADITNFDSLGIPYNYLGQNGFQSFQSRAPISLILLRYAKEDEYPYQSTLLSPDFSLETRISREEFSGIDNLLVPHQHNTYELIYIRSGVLYQRIENTRHKYIENSCCLMNRSVRHTWRYDTDFDLVNLSISRNFLLSLLNEGEDNYFRNEKSHTTTDLRRFLESEFEEDESARKKCIDFNPRSANMTEANLSIMFDQLISLTRNPGYGTSFLLRALTYSIFTSLNNKEYFDTTPLQLGTPTENRLFAEITQLMEQTDGRISRAKLSEELNYSGNYLNKIVQKFSGMNIFEYGNSFTMQKAAQLLADSELTISDLSVELGFSDRTHFYKLFKKEYGMTPKEYRRQNTGEHGRS